MGIVQDANEVATAGGASAGRMGRFDVNGRRLGSIDG
jgi:hypothetical protein